MSGNKDFKRSTTDSDHQKKGNASQPEKASSPKKSKLVDYSDSSDDENLHLSQLGLASQGGPNSSSKLFL